MPTPSPSAAAAQQLDLVHGQRGAHRGDANCCAAAAEGDGVGIHGAFDDDRDRAAEEVAGFGIPEECLALGEDRGVLGVEVLGACVVVVALGRVAAAEESTDGLALAVMRVADRHDQPVAEGIDVLGGAVAAIAVSDESGLFELVEAGAQ